MNCHNQMSCVSSQPTIADVLNVAWWTSAAAWWVSVSQSIIMSDLNDVVACKHRSVCVCVCVVLRSLLQQMLYGFTYQSWFMTGVWRLHWFLKGCCLRESIRQIWRVCVCGCRWGRCWRNGPQRDQLCDGPDAVLLQ